MRILFLHGFRGTIGGLFLGSVVSLQWCDSIYSERINDESEEVVIEGGARLVWLVCRSINSYKYGVGHMKYKICTESRNERKEKKTFRFSMKEKV